MAMGMFTGIPLPFHLWDEKLAAIMVASFPLIGLFIGGLWWFVGVLLMLPSFPVMIVAALLTVVPYWLAGFIHLDGYMDTSDAYLSWRPLDERLRILKDPNVGAFAVVMMMILLLLQFAAVYSVVDTGRFFGMVLAISIVSRACSSFCIFHLKHMPSSNYIPLLGEKLNNTHKIVVGLMSTGAAVFGVLYAGVVGVLVVTAVIAGYTLAIHVVYKSFKGISGDLLGYAMVIGEVCGLIALALLQNTYLWVLQ